MQIFKISCNLCCFRYFPTKTKQPFRFIYQKSCSLYISTKKNCLHFKLTIHQQPIHFFNKFSLWVQAWKRYIGHRFAFKISNDNCYFTLQPFHLLQSNCSDILLQNPYSIPQFLSSSPLVLPEPERLKSPQNHIHPYFHP